jgi:hypothetical protein
MKGTFSKVAAFLVIALLVSAGVAKAVQQNNTSESLETNVLSTPIINAQLIINPSTKFADTTEGGGLDTHFNANWLAEWWYLNGKVKLLSIDGKQRDLGFFVVVGHQESAKLLALPDKLSQLFHFYGLYPEDGTLPSFSYTETYIPRSYVGNFIALRTPYVDFKYPSDKDKVRMYGSGAYGYWLNYVPYGSGVAMNLVFYPNVIKTIDQTDYPLSFNTYERAYGRLYGSISLEGKTYWITSGEGYFDHMMPRSINEIWTHEFHG